MPRAAVLKTGRDSRRPKRVVADLRLDVGGRATAHHGVGVGLRRRFPLHSRFTGASEACRLASVEGSKNTHTDHAPLVRSTKD
jgi:hypothetical protein